MIVVFAYVLYLLVRWYEQCERGRRAAEMGAKR